MVPVLLALVAVALVVAVVAVATGRLPVDDLAPATRSAPDPGLPEEPRAADVPGLRFDTAARGYRMVEVDGHLDELAATLRERELEVERLREAAAPQPAPER